MKRIAWATLFVIASIGAGAAASEVPVLEPGDSVFWEGPEVTSGPQARPTDEVFCEGLASSYPGCAVTLYGSRPGALGVAAVGFATHMGTPSCEAAECIDFPLDVAAGGTTLRAAVDHPSTRDAFGIELWHDGHFVASAQHPMPNFLSAEAYAPSPTAGRWTIRVVLHDVIGSTFRVRAKLEGEPKTRSGLLLPNIRIVPPFELGFSGCQATEMVETAIKCLRFTTGPANIGVGPLDLYVEEPGTLGGANYQRLHYADGTTVARVAGRYAWHAPHGHYHHVGTASWSLWSADAVARTMRLVEDSDKKGFCMGDALIADWSSFDQDKQFTNAGSCTGVGDGPLGVTVGLTAGWADVYPSATEGNYIEFGFNPDGDYVLRAEIDPVGSILESNESDNESYTYFRVRDGKIQSVLERGFGEGPFDPARVVATDVRRGASGR